MIRPQVFVAIKPISVIVKYAFDMAPSFMESPLKWPFAIAACSVVVDYILFLGVGRPNEGPIQQVIITKQIQTLSTRVFNFLRIQTRENDTQDMFADGNQKSTIPSPSCHVGNLRQRQNLPI